MQPPIVDGLTETPQPTSSLLAQLAGMSMKKRPKAGIGGEKKPMPDMGPKMGPIAGPNVKTPI